MTYCENKKNLTKRIFQNTIILVILFLMMLPAISTKAFAETSVTVSGGDNVKGGDTFIVAVTFGDGSVGRVDAQLTYDTDKLTYISGGSSSGNSGYIQLKKAGTDGSITFNLKFQAITEGDTTLSVSTNEMYDLDEINMDRPSASKNVSISGNADSKELITEEISSDQPTEETIPAGVDEKEEPEDSTNLNFVFIISIAVLIVLIVTVAIVLKKKRK